MSRRDTPDSTFIDDLQQEEEEPRVLKSLKPNKKPPRKELTPEDWERIRQTRKQVNKIAQMHGWPQPEKPRPEYIDRLAMPNPHRTVPPRKLPGSQSTDALLESRQSLLESVVPIDTDDSLLTPTVCSKARKWKKGIHRPPRSPSAQQLGEMGTKLLGERLLSEALLGLEHKLGEQPTKGARARSRRALKAAPGWDETFYMDRHWSDSFLLPPVREPFTQPARRAKSRGPREHVKAWGYDPPTSPHAKPTRQRNAHAASTTQLPDYGRGTAADNDFGDLFGRIDRLMMRLRRMP